VQDPLPLALVLRQRLQEFVVETGLIALDALLEEERTAACGERYRHDPERRAWRHGHSPGELVLGGRRVSVSRPRARTPKGEEVVLPSWSAFAANDPLDERAVEQVVVGVSTRGYERSLEPLPASVKGRGASKSAVSRRFVRATKERLGELLHRRLEDLDLVALMIDGVHFADHVILVALGIDAEGRKHVLGLREGATENATACRALLVDLRERGLPTDRSILVVIDGAKALRRAALDVFGDRALIQRCQVHKTRNVEEQVPETMRRHVRASMNEAYATRDVARARKLLQNLAARLKGDHPSAASSLEEGLDETLTVIAFGLPVALERTLATTNPIDNVMGTSRRVTRNVKRWRHGSMILRWVATGLHEASRNFRRLRGYAGMPQLVAALRARDARLTGSVDSQAAMA
jgi:transposase-like protein